MKEGDTRAPLILGVVLTLLLLTFSVVLLRVYTRAMLLKQFGADDIWAVLSMHTARHQVFLTEEESRNYFKRKVFYVSIILYLVSLGAIKTTLLCQYYRAFAINKMRTVLLVAIVFVSAWSISQIFLNIFICTPIAAFWDRAVEGKCIPRNPTCTSLPRGDKAESGSSAALCPAWGLLRGLSNGLSGYQRRPHLGKCRVGVLVIHRTLLRTAMRLRPDATTFRFTVLSVNVQL
ncbi:hypothetical protein FOXB_09939 [Fusarium oxysporum f. sp. conglutinans Fo5176]|uniref:Rhodopsin domain-containing protein n=1 Tax=Fusarium oxysporum (strain Fo5176) TaxID=660025 RepID=F9FU58_FUSOF|nr:hypothetical protein FOXB_09939 [Fusarium oxysporum f. sp. conglutinans Fo5176]